MMSRAGEAPAISRLAKRGRNYAFDSVTMLLVMLYSGLHMYCYKYLYNSLNHSIGIYSIYKYQVCSFLFLDKGLLARNGTAQDQSCWNMH